MTKKFLILAGAVSLVMFIVSCAKLDNDNTCLNYLGASAERVNGPDSATVNEDISFAISARILNSCGQIQGFERSTNLDTTYIGVIAKYEGCNCTQETRVVDTAFKFRVTNPGKYYLKFWQDADKFISDSIVIKQ